MAAGVAHGYLLHAGQFTTLDYPGAKNTYAFSINAQGHVVGNYEDINSPGVGDTRNQGYIHGFLLSKGKYTSVDFPGAMDTWANAINSAGDIACLVRVPNQPVSGAVLKGGVWGPSNTAFLDRPSATSNPLGGINDAGATVGRWGTRAGGSHGVVYTKGSATEIDYGAGGATYANAINNAGDIVGFFYDANQMAHGFLRHNGQFTQIDYPGSLQSPAYGINDSGQVVGVFQDANKVNHGFVVHVTQAPPPPPVITVDGDRSHFPGSLRTIREAVAQAQGGATILVFPGTYRGSVSIIGQDKDGLSLIAAGPPDTVVIQGDYTERDGIHLENVKGVLLRGFTVRDFGIQATTATQWGTGNQIYLQNSHYNTIELNRVINGDRMGIMLADSGNNVIQHNLAWATNSSLATCGIHVQGKQSANNLFSQNFLYGNKVAGITLSDAGPGNRVVDNFTSNNGRSGITNTGTDGTWIEGNRVSYNVGPSGTTPYDPSFKGVGLGINVATSTGVTVFDNRGRDNTGVDVNWDGNGNVKFDSNACNKSTPSALCALPVGVPMSASSVPASADRAAEPPSKGR